MILRRTALTLLVGACAFAQTTTTTTTHDTSLGPIGVASTETVQINVANLASNSSTGTAASCSGSVSFNNATGNAIGTSTSFTLTAGQISSVALPFAKIGASGTRAEVVGVLSLTTTSTSDAPCDLHYSLETYDSTSGVTHVFVAGGAQAGPAGAGPVGAGQPGTGQQGGH
jgi:hypothetical protein